MIGAPDQIEIGLILKPRIKPSIISLPSQKNGNKATTNPSSTVIANTRMSLIRQLRGFI
jgi:hypothetical protein